METADWGYVLFRIWYPLPNHKPSVRSLSKVEVRLTLQPATKLKSPIPELMKYRVLAEADAVANVNT